MENNSIDRLAQMRETLIRQARGDDVLAQKTLAEMGVEWKEGDSDVVVVSESLDNKAVQAESVSILGGTEVLAPVAEPAVTTPSTIESTTVADKWQKELDSTLRIIESYSPQSKKTALENLRKKMVNGLAPGDILARVEGMQASPDLMIRMVDVVEANRQLELIYSNLDTRGKLLAAKRWKDKYGSLPETADMESQIDEILSLDPEKISEVEMGEEEQKEKIKTDVRMAMILELSEKVSSNMNIPGSFDQFVRAQTARYGMGKNHFPKEYESELKKEFYARAELSSVLSFWDDLAGTQSTEVDTFKDMTTAKIDQCKKLSRSTYEWLSEQKNVTYKKVEGLENTEGRVELREQMNIVSGEIYTKMMRRDFDVWTTRGEDRGKIISDLALSLGVSIDSIRLSWQLAEAECWAARMNVGFVSHPAGRVFIPSEYRDFWTRNGSPLGGSRLWQEYLSTHGNVYPESMEAPYSALGYGEKGVYDSEVRRLGRTGFEAWIVRIVDTEKENGYIDNRYNSGLRDGVIPLFSDRGGAPAELQDIVRTSTEIFRVVTKEGVALNMMPETSEVSGGINKLKKQPNEAYFVGGERALLAGKYFSCMEALVKQPGLLDVDLPQSVVMADLSKGAAVISAMDALGKVDATKASAKELTTLRNALVSLNFRFQSNDLVDRPEDKKSNRLVRVKDQRQEWAISSGTKERMSKSKARVGEMMEQWTRSYIWLLSWQNPAHESEEKVVNMESWVYLARDLVIAKDSIKQWGQYLGFGYGNTDADEKAVNPDGTPRQNTTKEMNKAAEEYVRWFDKLFFKVAKQIEDKNFPYSTSVARLKKEEDQSGTYGTGIYGPLFWRGKWW